jgi:acetyl esterase/lipase
MIDRDHIKNKFLDVPYCSASEAQKLDIYLPSTGSGPFPVLFHIHGGAFRMCDKADYQVDPFLKSLERGYAVVSANYRLSGEKIFPAAIHDLKAALRFLRANAAKYNLNPGKIFSVGGSAGGNLTLMLCVSSGRPELEDITMGNGRFPSDVQGGVAWFSPTDFLKMDEQLSVNGLGPCDHNDPDSPESEYIGGQITKVPAEVVQRANPTTYISGSMPPVFLQHGRKDHLVPWQQSQLFADKVAERLGASRARLEILETADHDDPQFKTDENMSKVLDFIDSLR